MQMLPDEQVVLESDGKRLILTSRRVRYRTETFGSANVISIMLENVASCGLVHSSYPTLLILAGLAVLGWIAGIGDSRTMWLVVAFALGIAYFATRRHVLAIASAGHTIRAAIMGMSTESVMQFIEELEGARSARSSTVRATQAQYSAQ